MKHLAVTGIYAHMGDFGCIIGAFEEDKIARLRLFSADRRTDIIDALSSQSAHVADTGRSIHIADESGTVETGGGAGTAPYIRHTDILLCFCKDRLRFFSGDFWHIAINGCCSVGQIEVWVIHFPFIRKFDVQMGTGGVSGVSYGGNNISGLYFLSSAYLQASAVRIQGLVAVIVFQNDIISIAGTISGSLDRAILYCQDLCAFRHCDIKPVMHLHFPGCGRGAVAVIAADLAGPILLKRRSEKLTAATAGIVDVIAFQLV